MKLTEFWAASTVNVEWEVASSFSSIGTQISKDQTIRTEFLSQDEVTTFVVAIALDSVCENSVLFRTIALSCLLCVDYNNREIRNGNRKSEE